LNRSDSHRAGRSIHIGMVLLPVILAAAGLAFCSDAPKEQANTPEQPALLRLLRESRAPYQSFATRFSQRKRLAMLDVSLDSEGMIFFQRPGSVRYEILSPVRSLMMYDGKKVRCYAWSEGKWNLINSPGATAIGQVLRQIGRWVQGDFDTDQKMFELKVIPADNGGGCIHLLPRSKAVADYIKRIEIYVEKASDYRVTRVVIMESEVDTTDMRFSQELHNPPIPEGAFASPQASDACQAVFPKAERSDPNEAGKKP
jgi:hypothetical protein